MFLRTGWVDKGFAGADTQPRKRRSGDALTLARTAREVLNEVRWRTPDRFPETILRYRDRTASDGFRLIRGFEIVDLERRYFRTARARLPYYKIDRIEWRGEILFERSA